MTVNMAYRVSPYAYLDNFCSCLSWLDVGWMWCHLVATCSLKRAVLLPFVSRLCLHSNKFIPSTSFTFCLMLVHFLLLLCFCFIIFLSCFLDFFIPSFSDSPLYFHSIQGGWGLHHLGRVKNCVSQSTHYTNCDLGLSGTGEDYQ